MIAYVEGKFTYKSPAYIIVETGGIGYQVHISLHTYGLIQQAAKGKLHTYFHVKEDAHTLYGFAEELEKNLFVQLISVSGVGPATARMILSSMPPDEIRRAIVQEDVATIERVKGIGPKSAKRLVLELKDKLLRMDGGAEISASPRNTLKEEALSALVMLGFSRQAAEKAIQKVSKESGEELPVEELVKRSLKQI